MGLRAKKILFVLTACLLGTEALGSISICGYLVSKAHKSSAHEAMERAFVSPDGLWAAMPNPAEPALADIIELSSNTSKGILEIPGYSVRNASFAQQGDYALAYDSLRSVAAVFSVPSGKRIAVHSMAKFPRLLTPFMALSPDGSLLARIGSNRIEVLDSTVADKVLATGTWPFGLSRPALLMTKSNKIIAFDKDQVISYNRLGNELLEEHKFDVARPPFLSRLEYTEEIHEREAAAFPEPISYEERRANLVELEKPQFQVLSASVNAEGSLFCLAEDYGLDELAGTRVRLWKVETGKPEIALGFPGLKRAMATAFSEEGQYLAVSGFEGRSNVTYVVDLTSRKIAAKLTGQTPSLLVNTVAFTKDRKQLLLSTDSDPQIWGWDLSKLTNSEADASSKP